MRQQLLPFVEFDLQKQLMLKLKVLGMNAAMGYTSSVPPRSPPSSTLPPHTISSASIFRFNGDRNGDLHSCLSWSVHSSLF
jgi:hypothetical protein